MSEPNSKPTLLCVANWDSNVGYAWWLMESFWVKIHAEFSTDYEVVITYPSISILPAAIHDAQIRTTAFDFGVNKLANLAQHLRFIKQHNVTAIYFSDRPTSHWSYLFFKLAGVKKIIVHDHTPGIRTRPTGLRKFLKSCRARIPLLAVDAAIGATEYVKDRLINISCLPAKKCFAAPNGIPITEATQNPPLDLRAQLGVAAETLLIVSTGRANLYKGVDFALDVFAQLVHQQKCHGFHFIYCGDGPDLEFLKTMAHSLAIGNHVTFLGRVNNIDQILNSCDIAFHPSRGEVGYSLAILEYMRAGLPVLVSSNPSVCEATQHLKDGLIYQEGNLQDACQKMTQLLSDGQLRQSLGNQGKRAIVEKYSLAATHKALIAALQKTLAE
ncbi:MULTISPECIES: glycosyltransferase family 4 protein [Cellvibrio]|uniref:Glycosyltransferase involved in cell wall biosynthesis n=1 Tax=Cellvibrio fibrivorans TaxID=126350 RepID=A0ABU1UU07_9GAMM|nr:glycosyltransferase family 4 protein [Cellvibrio fibrivorans]MDR7088659.1 glycosyltransferase involved in cell wall biosynthesis [Cellvibrio fibrivorans]